MSARAEGLRLLDENGDVLAVGMHHRNKRQWRVHAVFDVDSEADAEALVARLATALKSADDP